MALIAAGVVAWLAAFPLAFVLRPTRHAGAYILIVPPAALGAAWACASAVEALFGAGADGSFFAIWCAGLAWLAGAYAGAFAGWAAAGSLNVALELPPFLLHATAESRAWWQARRRLYNLSLFVCGWAGYALALAVMYARGAPPATSEDWSYVTLGGGLLYGVVMSAANVLYFLGPVLERFIRARWLSVYRTYSFRAGMALSVVVPLVLGAAFGLIPRG